MVTKAKLSLVIGGGGGDGRGAACCRLMAQTGWRVAVAKEAQYGRSGVRVNSVSPGATEEFMAAFRGLSANKSMD